MPDEALILVLIGCIGVRRILNNAFEEPRVVVGDVVHDQALSTTGAAADQYQSEVAGACGRGDVLLEPGADAHPRLHWRDVAVPLDNRRLRRGTHLERICDRARQVSIERLPAHPATPARLARTPSSVIRRTTSHTGAPG